MHLLLSGDNRNQSGQNTQLAKTNEDTLRQFTVHLTISVSVSSSDSILWSKEDLICKQHRLNNLFNGQDIFCKNRRSKLIF